MGYTPVQRWKGTAQREYPTSLSLAFDSQPTTGNIVFAAGEFTLGAAFVSLTDDTGDGVSWTEHPNSRVIGTATAKLFLFYKKMGTPSGGGKTVTLTKAGPESAIALHIAEYSHNDTSSPPALDGTVPTNTGSGTSASTGDVITTNNGSLILIVSSTGNTSGMIPTTTNNATVRSITRSWSGVFVSDFLTTVSGTYAFDFLNMHSATWATMTAGFKNDGTTGGGYPTACP